MKRFARPKSSVKPTPRLGKLPPALLERLVRWSGAPNHRVLLGPGCGVDAAAGAGRQGLVLKSDHVTFTTIHLGPHVVRHGARGLCRHADLRARASRRASARESG